MDFLEFEVEMRGVVAVAVAVAVVLVVLALALVCLVQKGWSSSHVRLRHRRRCLHYLVAWQLLNDAHWYWYWHWYWH